MPRRYYFWIWTKDPQNNNRPYLVFGGNTDAEARERAFTMLGGLDFEIKRYPTRDLATASAFARGKRLDAGEGLHASVERIGHQRSLERVRRRRIANPPTGTAWE